MSAITSFILGIDLCLSMFSHILLLFIIIYYYADGAEILSASLRTNHTLRRLDISSSILLSEGAKALAPGLASSSTLEELYLHHNEIGPDGAYAIAQALTTGLPRLHTLFLDANLIDGEVCACIYNYLSI